MRNCVIHRRFVEAMRNRSNSLKERNLAVQACFNIEAIIRDDPLVVLLDTGDPASVVDYFKRGEKVILYGAFRKGCLETARDALLSKGIIANYHPTGSIYPDDVA